MISQWQARREPGLEIAALAGLAGVAICGPRVWRDPRPRRGDPRLHVPAAVGVTTPLSAASTTSSASSAAPSTATGAARAATRTRAHRPRRRARYRVLGFVGAWGRRQTGRPARAFRASMSRTTTCDDRARGGVVNFERRQRAGPARDYFGESACACSALWFPRSRHHDPLLSAPLRPMFQAPACHRAPEALSLAASSLTFVSDAHRARSTFIGIAVRAASSSSQRSTVRCDVALPRFGSRAELQSLATRAGVHGFPPR
jgi:hypothetical protein